MELGPIGGATLGMAARARASKVASGAGVAVGGLGGERARWGERRCSMVSVQLEEARSCGVDAEGVGGESDSVGEGGSMDTNVAGEGTEVEEGTVGAGLATAGSGGVGWVVAA